MNNLQKHAEEELHLFDPQQLLAASETCDAMRPIVFGMVEHLRQKDFVTKFEAKFPGFVKETGDVCMATYTKNNRFVQALYFSKVELDSKYPRVNKDDLETFGTNWIKDNSTTDALMRYVEEAFCVL